MRQVLQSVRSGQLSVAEVPNPRCGAAEVLVRVTHSIVSAGTERAVRELASASLVGKAKARPDLVRQVVAKARTDGPAATFRSVRNKLDDDMALGYSACGEVVGVGEAVRGIVPGQWVATGGQGHADYQAVAANLAVALPDGVAPQSGAFATVASIAMHGLRQADLGPGSRVCVVGLGLLGQLTVRLAVAAGFEVCGIDVQPWNVERAALAGATAFLEAGEDTTHRILAWSRGRGVDAVLLTAATKSSSPMMRAPAILRDRGVAVVVGDVGLELARTPFYEKELSIRFARSYGPGRYDRSYEEWGVDYPIGHVRFTEGRNMEAFLDLLASGRLAVDDLITHSFSIDEAASAYEVIAGKHGPFLGVQLTYPDAPAMARPPAATAKRRSTRGLRLGLLGAGNFARATLLPAIDASGIGRVTAVSSRSGLSAVSLAERRSIGTVHDSAEALIADPDIDVVVIATPHDTHAALAAAALDAGKHVFCEKPLALSSDELDLVEQAWLHSDGHLAVGFNRRHSPHVVEARRVLGELGGPLIITCRVNAGDIPAKHWTQDRLQGGRLLGEVCHFVDTCAALAQSPIASVHAFGSGRDELLLEDDLVVSLRFQNGSLATIAYATGGSTSTPKERIDILGRGHTLVIDDFRVLIVDEKGDKPGRQDKGHAAQLRRFRAIIEGKEPDGTNDALASSRAILAAAMSLGTGGPVAPDSLIDLREAVVRSAASVPGASPITATSQHQVGKG